MKKLLPLLIIILLTLVGCKTVQNPTPSPSAEPTPTSGFNIKDITVVSGSQSVKALRKLNYSSTFNGKSMLAADGYSDMFIPEIYPDAPILNGTDFSVSGLDADFVDVRLYDQTQRIAVYTSLDALKEALSQTSGEYLVGINYLYTGRYIPSLDQTENACYTYFFRLSF